MIAADHMLIIDRTATVRDLLVLKLEIAFGQVECGAEQAKQTDQVADGEVSKDCVHFSGVAGVRITTAKKVQNGLRSYLKFVLTCKNSRTSFAGFPNVLLDVKIKLTQIQPFATFIVCSTLLGCTSKTVRSELLMVNVVEAGRLSRV